MLGIMPPGAGMAVGPASRPATGQRRGLNKRGAPKGASGPAAVYLPPPIYSLFVPRVAVEWKPKPGVQARELSRERNRTAGVGALMGLFENAPTDDGTIKGGEAGEIIETVQLTPRELFEKKKKEKLEKAAKKLEEAIVAWDPHAPDNKHTKDAYKTLFVGRLSYSVTPEALKSLMEEFGEVTHAHIVEDLEGRSRGYGFVEFAEEAAMRAACKRAGGRMVEGRRIIVDVERGRTIRNWKPRRLGGGLGGQTRRGRPSPSPRRGMQGDFNRGMPHARPSYSRREQQPRFSRRNSSTDSNYRQRENFRRLNDDRRRDDRRDERRDGRYSDHGYTHGRTVDNETIGGGGWRGRPEDDSR